MENRRADHPGPHLLLFRVRTTCTAPAYCFVNLVPLLLRRVNFLLFYALRPVGVAGVWPDGDGANESCCCYEVWVDAGTTIR